jgi:uncharacterized membrane protein
MPAFLGIYSAIAAATIGWLEPAGQDRKKEALQPATWPAWESKTSYWPFAAIISGKAELGGFGMHALVGGLMLWLAATWLHMPLAGWKAGVWRWF